MTNEDTKQKLKNITLWLECRFNQDSKDYSIFEGSKPMVLRYDEETAVSTWACGAIVCMGSHLMFIGEDDGNWFVNEDESEYGHYAYQPGFSIGWTKSFTKAMADLEEYVKEHGEPVYYSGLEEKIICHYTLKKGES